MSHRNMNRRGFFGALVALPWAISAKPEAALPLHGELFREPTQGYMIGSTLMSALDDKFYSVPCTGHIIDFSEPELTAARYDWDSYFRSEPVLKMSGGHGR